jgi:predicted metal-dependent peptidase
MTKERQETRVKRGHIALMKHSETALYSGVMLMGTTAVEDGISTAYTDGVNKKYGRQFLEGITEEPKVRGLILHENLHVALKQVMYGKAMFKESPKMANLAADFVVNDIIVNITGTIGGSTERVVQLPDGGVYDEMFHNWSMREVFNYLKKNAKPKDKPKGKGGQKGGQSNEPPEGGTQDSDDGTEWESVEVNGKTYDLSNSDEHDFDLSDVSHEKLKDMNDAIDRALREGGMLAGRMGAKMPRAISDLLEPKIDWKEVLREFVSSTMRGKDEFTWRRMNKRHLANDIYMPSMENETIGEIIVAIDTSGSIGSAEITEFATELVSICDVVQPDKVRILWWDTEVHGEQVFEENYTDIAKLLKPLGGGGTNVSCVSEYVNKQNLQAECVLVFTDGYLENDIKWNINSPTLWMITRNRHFDAPTGKKVVIDRD